MSVSFENALYELYLEYFHKAEDRRRWNLQRDIPWAQVNRQPDAQIVQVVQSFMAVELYLPDYTSKILHLVRASRGRAWFQANWGYEESKHSLALEMWLVNSGSCSNDQIRDFEATILGREWNLPYHTPLEMIVYTTLQEFATALNYRGLRRVAENSQDPALAQALALLARDEVGHFQFFRDSLALYMKHDRDAALEALNKVIHTFRMPAQDIVPDWNAKGRLITALGIFNDRIFLREVVRPVLQSLGVSVLELRGARQRLAAADCIATPAVV
ncbi:MAG: acyl-ACP desaturase [Proteobacteria bacterium]|nr:acyl-ACP desaturase [Pseudomonadota bacterium]